MDDDLRLLAQKLRSHIKLLIFLEEKYALHNSKKQKHAKYIFQNLQNEIERYIKAYSKENISKGIPNIFDEKYEYGSHWNSQPILVNLITKAINRFEASSRKGVIKILVSSNKDNLKMLLILFNNMDSEADKQYISNEIKKVNVQEYLDSQYWLPNLERAMIEAANSEVFKDQALELLKFVEQRIDRQHNKHEWRRLIYRIKLLLAYYDGENEKLAQIQMPEENVHLSTSEKHLLPNDSLDFFTALVMLRQGNAITAYSIFNRLLSNNPLDVQFAVNRFAAKVKIAVSSSENDSEEGRASFSEALEEWAEYQKKSIDIDIAQSVFYEAIQYNKLVCCNALDMLAEFENCWNQLYFTKQYSNDFMKLRVDYLLKQDRKINAYDLLKNAKNYHKLYSDAYPTFFNEIEKQIENPKVIEEFRTDFKRILQLTPEKIIEVVSKNDTTGNLTVGSFLLKEINLACDSILENILSVKSVKNEDKYNDLLTLTLNSKLNFIQWTVKDQPRGGKSNTNKNNPGERDFKIEASGERIAIIEALRLNSIAQGSIESHYKKTFNYEPSRKLYYLLTYFEGTNFNAAWEKYKKMIFKIKMASDLEIDGIIEDVLPIGPHDSIKSACARLKNGGEYFHIFMNMNYLAKRD